MGIVRPFPATERNVVPDDHIEQSMQATVMGLRWIGIPLDPSRLRSPFLRKCCIAFGWIIFLINLIGNFVLFLHVTDKMLVKLALKITTTSSWSILINNFNIKFLILMNHSGLFLYVCPNWKELTLIIGVLRAFIFTITMINRVFGAYFSLGTFAL